jgi:hypothetical protein
LVLIHAKESKAQTTPRATEDRSLLRRTYLGLTQTCAQLRSEFLPLYSEHLQVVSCVDISAIVPYSETFIQPYQGLGPSALQSTVSVTLRNCGRIPLEPIISLYERVPGLRIRPIFPDSVLPTLQHGYFGILAMTNAEMNPTFAAYYRRCITKIEVEVTKGSFSHICSWVYLKPEYKEDWMSLSSGLTTVRMKTDEWVNSSGLSTAVWGYNHDDVRFG